MTRFFRLDRICGDDMSDTAELIVQRQVEAYNARDLEAFAACFSDTIEIFDFPDRPILRGKPALRERYARRFSESEDLHAEIRGRFSSGTYVVDIEDLTGSAFGAAPAAVIYEVSHNLITRAWFIRNATI